jgi:S1-C subfamily serine protease
MMFLRRPRLPSFTTLLACALATGALGADTPALLDKATPASVAELRALEAQVQKVLAKVVPCTVGIRIGPGQGSGVIVSADGYVLTAGHVSEAPGRDAIVVLPSGKTLRAKTLGRNIGADSGLLKIIDPGPYPFVEMGKSSTLQKGQWVVAIGHPGGFRANRTPVVRLGRVLFANPFIIRTDCTIVGGDSGGPLFDLEGKVVGIHSKIGNTAITENFHVPIDTYREHWDRLARAESWNDNPGSKPLVASAGGKIVFEKAERLSSADAIDRYLPGAYRKTFTLPLKAGATYTFDLKSKQFDAFLRLEDPDGKKLAEDDDSGGNMNARIVHRARQDGEYRIIATTFEPGQVGSFTLRVREADPLEKRP